jgi:alpha-glucosidase
MALASGLQLMRRVRPIISVVAFAVAIGTAVPAIAQWSSIGAMPAPRRDGQSLVFRNSQGVVAVSAVAPGIIRVRFAPGPKLGRDHSYAVIASLKDDPSAKFEIGRGRSRIAAGGLTVSLNHSPFRLSFADANGNSLDEDDPEKGIAFSGNTVRVWKRLRDDEQVYGLGEKTGRLNKRGRQLGGYNYTMWNSDTFAYESDTDPIYVSVPFFMVLRQGRTHGIFLDNTYRSNFDIGHQSQGLLAFGADGGELNYYFIDGPTPRSVLERFTTLTGRMPLPPLWALGYHQCRYSYYPESRVRYIADGFRVRRIPADAIWLDIHYMDGYKPFTWDRERFPDPAGLIRDLRKAGFRTITIIDPHPKKEKGYEPYDSGIAGDHLVKNANGTVYEAPVWPSQAEKNPGASVFPDFSKPAARDWWGRLYRSLLDIGVAGIWNDMNEPAVFETPTGTMPLDVRHDNEGQPTDHRQIHNVYGLLMTRSTYEGLRRLRPNDRPFVLTRASYAGGQRYSALWPGDNVSDWTQLRATIPILAGMGLSGLPFVGSDIGGFAEAPSAELFTRWLQTGVFYPFMRTHTAFGTPDQEPWSYGTAHEAINRRAIELRYELLPHIYNVMRETSVSGMPALRPLVFDYPGDPRTYALDDQFMFGDDLLIAPVLREGATEREVYLPKGDWYDFWTGRQVAGGASTRPQVTMSTIPIFVRAGAFVFRQPVVQHTGEMTGQPLRVTAYPAAGSERWLYEDDGATMEYEKGQFVRRRFAQQRTMSGDKTVATIEVGGPEGPWRPASRDLEVTLPWAGEPSRVLIGGSAISRVTPDELRRQPQGWTQDADGIFVTIKLPDRFEAVRVTIEGLRQ